MIITADWHLREDTPICRKDDFMMAQWGKIRFIKELQRKCNCPVLIAGDLFHHWKPSPLLLALTISYLPNDVYLIPGNHDLPQHNSELFYKSGLAVLEASEKVNIVSKEMKGELELNGLKILLLHQLTYKYEKPFPEFKGKSAYELLEEYSNYDLIVTGDNHKPFVVKQDGRMLINPGSVTRQRTVEKHIPRVYYYKDGKLKKILLTEKGWEEVLSEEHIIVKQERNDMLEAIISKLSTNWELSVSFEENLERFIHENDLEKEIVDKIHKVLGRVKS